MSLSTAALILAQLITSSSLNPWAPSSSSAFGKSLFTLEFLRFHLIVILVWNEWFFCIHTIWVWNDKILLLLFHGFIFPNPSPIIWLMWSCRLWCINSYLFLQSNYPPPSSYSCWIMLIYWYNYILSDSDPCHLSDELLMAVSHHHILIATVLNKKYAATCWWLLM